MSLTNENTAIKFNIEDFDITQLSSPDMHKVEINNVYYNIFKKTYDTLATSNYVNKKIKKFYKSFFKHNLQSIANNFYEKIKPNVINYYSENVFNDIFSISFNEYISDSIYISKHVKTLMKYIEKKTTNKDYIQILISENPLDPKKRIYFIKEKDFVFNKKSELSLPLYFYNILYNNDVTPMKLAVPKSNVIYEVIFNDNRNVKTEILKDIYKHTVIKYIEHQFVKLYYESIDNRTTFPINLIYKDIESFRIRNANTLVEQKKNIVNELTKYCNNYISNSLELSWKMPLLPIISGCMNITKSIHNLVEPNEIVSINDESTKSKLEQTVNNYISECLSIFEIIKTKILSLSVYSSNDLANTFIDNDFANNVTQQLAKSFKVVTDDIIDIYNVFDKRDGLNDMKTCLKIIENVFSKIFEFIKFKCNNEIIENKHFELSAVVINTIYTDIENEISAKYDKRNDIISINENIHDKFTKLLGDVVSLINNYLNYYFNLYEYWLNMIDKKIIRYMTLDEIKQNVFDFDMNRIENLQQVANYIPQLANHFVKID